MAAMAVAMAVLLAPPAWGQTRESTERAAARKLGYAGVEAYQANDFGVASEKLEKAYAVLRVPSLGLWAARALVKQGKLVEAVDRYVEVARLSISGGDAAVQREAQREAQAELAPTQALVPSVVIRVEGAGAGSLELSIDGARMSSQLAGEATPLNPGSHSIEGKSGSAHDVVQVTLEPRDQKEVVLRLQKSTPAPAAAPGPSDVLASPATESSDGASGAAKRRTLGWVVLGSGAAALIVGGVAGGQALSKKGSLDEDPACKDDRSCPVGHASDVDSLNQLRTISTVGLIAGGALAATGFVLLVTAPKAKTPSTALLLSPSSVSLRGTF